VSASADRGTLSIMSDTNTDEPETTDKIVEDMRAALATSEREEREAGERARRLRAAIAAFTGEAPAAPPPVYPPPPVYQPIPWPVPSTGPNPFQPPFIVPAHAVAAAPSAPSFTTFGTMSGGGTAITQSPLHPDLSSVTSLFFGSSLASGYTCSS
jgi:hypothetical protein